MQAVLVGDPTDRWHLRPADTTRHSVPDARISAHLPGSHGWSLAVRVDGRWPRADHPSAFAQRHCSDRGNLTHMPVSGGWAIQGKPGCGDLTSSPP